MREILFRGKIDYSGEWVQGYYEKAKYCVTDRKLYDYISVPHPEEKFRQSDHFIVNPATVGQYAGLTDRNGKEIFEGDIVEFFGMRGTITQECGAFGIGTRNPIDYDALEKKIPLRNRPYFCYNDNFISLWELWWNYEQDENPLYEVEVIGNIHNDPELLEVAL